MPPTPRLAASYYVVRKYRDTFLPSVTLSLALEYMHKKLSDIEVVLGKYIRILSPQMFDTASQKWGPYRVTVTPPTYDDQGNVTKPGTYRTMSEIRIPIDQYGSMLINYMGSPSSSSSDGRQTFPVRSYSGYAVNPVSTGPAKWPNTKALGNKIVMVGPFYSGYRRRPETDPVRTHVRGGDARQRAQHDPDG